VSPLPWAIQSILTVGARQEGLQDYGLDEDWLLVAKSRAQELEASEMCSAALRADAASRLELIIQQRANSLAAQLHCSEEAALAKTTADYFASPDVIIASYAGDFKKAMWPPIRLEDPKIVKQAYIDALDLPAKKILALQHATSAYFASTLSGAQAQSGAQIR
jgi:hypothetical protein